MENKVLKRNITEKIKYWEDYEEGPLLLYGLKGVGKAFICHEYAKLFHDSFLHYEPELSLTRDGCIEDPAAHIGDHFGLSKEALEANFLILNETEKAEGFFLRLLKHAVTKSCRWIFISDYDYTIGSDISSFKKLHMYPLQFDEFLTNLGYNDWYVNSIGETLMRHEKLPDIVHNNLISTFEEYLWTGGMPEVVNEYIRENRLGINAKQNDAKLLIYNTVNFIKETSLKTKCLQILDTLDEQLSKPNKKFMFSLIRNGVTYNMYSESIDELVRKGLVLKIEELSDNRKFKLYHPEFTFNKTQCFDEITDVEFLLREENYILATMLEYETEVYFWESGNRAELPFIIKKKDGSFIPVDYLNDIRRSSKSISSYQSRHTSAKALKITNSNFVEEDSCVNIPVYSIFYLEKLLEELL